MFKRFSVEENVSSNSAVKSSVLRGIRSSLLETYPRIEPVIDDVLPKKGKPVTVAKCSGRVTLISCDGHVLFFQERVREEVIVLFLPAEHEAKFVDLARIGQDGPIFPTIRLLHQCELLMPRFWVTVKAKFLTQFISDPFIMPKMQVDQGAIKFVLNGSHIFCAGFTRYA
jgi:PUA domain protein